MDIMDMITTMADGPADIYGYGLIFRDLPDTDADIDSFLEADADPSVPFLSAVVALPLLSSPPSISKSRASCASFTTACASSDSMMGMEKDIDMALTTAREPSPITRLSDNYNTTNGVSASTRITITVSVSLVSAMSQTMSSF
jgi:hypothetical protein